MALPYEPRRDPVSGLPADYYTQWLPRTEEAAAIDLNGHDFDAVACAGDFHGVAVGALTAAAHGKALVIACARDVVTLGSYQSGDRLAYVDDFFTLGASQSHTLKMLGPDARVTATYQAQVREYTCLARTREEPRYDQHLARCRHELFTDLSPHLGTFDALVCCCGSFRSLALASLAGASMGLPVVIVCDRPHDEVVSHIVTLGDFDPRMRLCYVDAAPAALEYMNQGGPARITATYGTQSRQFTAVSQ